MTTLVQPMSGTRTGLVLAWSITLLAILAIGLVVVAAPMPQLSAATANDGVPAEAHSPGLPGDTEADMPGFKSSGEMISPAPPHYFA